MRTVVDLDRALAAFADLEQPRGPTVRELQHALDISSTSVVKYQLQRLQRLGHIELIPPTEFTSASRGYRLTPAGRLRVEALSGPVED